MLIPILLALNLCIGLEASNQTEPPDAVQNLRVFQVGFDGLFMANWDVGPNTDRYNDRYDLKVLTDTEMLEYPGVLFEKQLMTVEKPIEGFTYTLQITPYSFSPPYNLDGEKIMGPSSNTSFIFQGRDTAISPPTNFEYESIDCRKYRLRWQWGSDSTRQDNNTWFFVRICDTYSNHCDEQLITNETTIIPDDLFREIIYNVSISAHIGDPLDSKPVVTSEPLEGTIRTCATPTPTPKRMEITPIMELATMDLIPYNVSWYLWPTDNLINVTIEAYSTPDGSRIFPYMTKGINGYGQNLTFDLEYNTIYFFTPYVFYNETGGWISKKVGDYGYGATIQGPSKPVEKLGASQNGFGNSVTVTWKGPRNTHGPLCRYDVRITNENGSEVQPRQKVDKTLNSTIVTIENANYGPVYNITVIPVGLQVSNNTEIFGQPAVTRVVLQRFPWWGIVLIVMASIALIVGGAFYYVRRRNGLQRVSGQRLQ